MVHLFNLEMPPFLIKQRVYASLFSSRAFFLHEKEDAFEFVGILDIHYVHLVSFLFVISSYQLPT